MSFFEVWLGTVLPEQVQGGTDATGGDAGVVNRVDGAVADGGHQRDQTARIL